MNRFTISLIVFILAVILFIGWAIFSIFGGVGLTALPFDMINEFKNRPKPITQAE
jgi:LMBR1 domain-containing protein 1